MKILAIILAGGKGTRLAPLSDKRCKPAVPFGGRFRIIDFALSNCINSGIRQINVMVQYLSDSLQKHIRDGWSILSPALGEYIDVYPPQQRRSEQWYLGTADAIYQNIFTIEEENPDYVLILAGDHIYKMDYRELINYHREKRADLTIATIPVNLDEGSSFGIMEVNSKGQIVGFEEKPENPKPLSNNPDKTLASMGIYIFTKNVLNHRLMLDADSPSSHDFGKDIIPKMLTQNKVFSFPFQHYDGSPRYWRDVGTLNSYYQANMDLLDKNCSLDVFSEYWKFRTCQTQSAPTMIAIEENSSDYLINSIVSGGAIIRGKVKNSILSPEVVIEQGAEVDQSVLFSSCHIKKGAKIKKAIIEKEVIIPPGYCIGYDREKDKKRFKVTSEGITVVARGSIG